MEDHYFDKVSLSKFSEELKNSIQDLESIMRNTMQPVNIDRVSVVAEASPLQGRRQNLTLERFVTEGGSIIVDDKSSELNSTVIKLTMLNDE